MTQTQTHTPTRAAALTACRAHGIALTEWRRDWDGAVWPHATAGFFKVRQKIPRILEHLMPA